MKNENEAEENEDTCEHCGNSVTYCDNECFKGGKNGK